MGVGSRIRSGGNGNNGNGVKVKEYINSWEGGNKYGYNFIDDYGEK
jgi:hypothetical protein